MTSSTCLCRFYPHFLYAKHTDPLSFHHITSFMFWVISTFFSHYLLWPTPRPPEFSCLAFTYPAGFKPH